jgi:hypothetical protein
MDDVRSRLSNQAMHSRHGGQRVRARRRSTHVDELDLRPGCCHGSECSGVGDAAHTLRWHDHQVLGVDVADHVDDVP